MEQPDWAPNDIGRFADRIETSLRQRGIEALSADARNSAYRRVELAINQLGPHLFPLIVSAEKKVIGTRPVPESTLELRCANYEVHGVIDVLTNVSLGEAASTNLIKNEVELACPGMVGDYEVIVDYKGSHRPLIGDDYWNQGEWQVQTYAWLREKQPESFRVAAGILIYINELTPGNKEMQNLRKGIANNATDVIPEPGSEDERLVRLWRPGNEVTQLSVDFRMKRAIRIIPITEESIQEALSQFDNVVRRAEEDIISEADSGSILDAWSPTCGDEDTCSACDFEHFCPHPAGKPDNYRPGAPDAP